MKTTRKEMKSTKTLQRLAPRLLLLGRSAAVKKTKRWIRSRGTTGSFRKVRRASRRERGLLRTRKGKRTKKRSEPFATTRHRPRLHKPVNMIIVPLSRMLMV